MPPSWPRAEPQRAIDTLHLGACRWGGRGAQLTCASGGGAPSSFRKMTLAAEPGQGQRGAVVRQRRTARGSKQRPSKGGSKQRPPQSSV